MADYGMKKNAEGYNDPTAYQGTKSIIQAENEQRRLNSLIYVLKQIIDEYGFELIERIKLKDQKSGREYR